MSRLSNFLASIERSVENMELELSKYKMQNENLREELVKERDNNSELNLKAYNTGWNAAIKMMEEKILQGFYADIKKR